MGRAKGLTAVEKATIMKEIAKGTNAKNIARLLCRHIYTVKRFVADPSLRKKRLDFEDSDDTGTLTC